MHSTKMLHPTAHPHQTLIALNVIKTAIRYRNLVMHMRTHVTVFYSCAICQRTFSTLQLLGKRIQVYHSASHASPCTICTISSTDLNFKIISGLSTQPVTCNLCGRYFTTNYKIHQHIEDQHKLINK